MADSSPRKNSTSAQVRGPGTPEILQTRRDNINRNAAMWNALGLPPDPATTTVAAPTTAAAAAAAGGGSASGVDGRRIVLSGAGNGGSGGGGGSGGRGSGNLLSAVGAAVGGRGGGGGRRDGGGGEGAGGVLVPLGELVKLWPGRKEEIYELAGLLGEVGFGMAHTVVWQWEESQALGLVISAGVLTIGHISYRSGRCGHLQVDKV